MLMKDIRYASRTLRRSPGFTSAAIACLALGIGASTAIFSIVNAVVLKPLPTAMPSRYARLYTQFPDFPNGGLPKFWFSPPEFREMQKENRAWDQLEAWAVGGASLEGSSEPLRVSTCYVSGGLLKCWGSIRKQATGSHPSQDRPGIRTTIVLSTASGKGPSEPTPTSPAAKRGSTVQKP